jgi:hypothetical protein
MKIRNLLIIDDEQDEDLITNMSEQLLKDGFEVRPFYMNPKSKKYEIKKRDAPAINLTGFWKDLKQNLTNNNIHIVACDYVLGMSGTANGISVLSKIKNEFHFKGTNILFSTKIDNILNEILNSEINSNKKKEQLKKLIKSHIVDFPSRTELCDVLKGIIRNNQFDEINLKQEILNWLYAFESHKFNGHPELERKTLGQVAKAIESGSLLGVQFQKLLIEQGISTMIKLNKIPANE